ncbi:hypothetical protein [Crucivirus-458]|nr:hypothetical protein [Crucivirus-458]
MRPIASCSSGVRIASGWSVYQATNGSWRWSNRTRHRGVRVCPAPPSAIIIQTTRDTPRAYALRARGYSRTGGAFVPECTGVSGCRLLLDLLTFLDFPGWMVHSFLSWLMNEPLTISEMPAIYIAILPPSI